MPNFGDKFLTFVFFALTAVCVFLFVFVSAANAATVFDTTIYGVDGTQSGSNKPIWYQPEQTYDFATGTVSDITLSIKTNVTDNGTPICIWATDWPGVSGVNHVSDPEILPYSSADYADVTFHFSVPFEVSDKYYYFPSYDCTVSYFVGSLSSPVDVTWEDIGSQSAYNMGHWDTNAGGFDEPYALYSYVSFEVGTVDFGYIDYADAYIPQFTTHDEWSLSNYVHQADANAIGLDRLWIRLLTDIPETYGDFDEVIYSDVIHPGGYVNSYESVNFVLCGSDAEPVKCALIDTQIDKVAEGFNFFDVGTYTLESTVVDGEDEYFTSFDFFVGTAAQKKFITYNVSQCDYSGTFAEDMACAFTNIVTWFFVPRISMERHLNAVADGAMGEELEDTGVFVGELVEDILDVGTCPVPDIGCFGMGTISVCDIADDTRDWSNQEPQRSFFAGVVSIFGVILALWTVRQLL